MKPRAVRSRIRQQELNPVFHWQNKEEDDKVLSKARIKQALKSGVLNLAGQGLVTGKWPWNFVTIRGDAVIYMYMFHEID